MAWSDSDSHNMVGQWWDEKHTHKRKTNKQTNKTIPHFFFFCRSVVYLEIDNRQCLQQSTECFQSATDVAAFLGALASSGSLDTSYVIEAVTSK